MLTTRSGLALIATSAASGGGPVSAVVRPETIQLSHDAPSLANKFRGRVAWSTYVGGLTRCRVSLDGGAEFNVTLPQTHPMLPLAAGDVVWLGWPPGATLVVPDDRP